MPNPTVDEVRELLDLVTYMENMVNPKSRQVIISLCRHFLASPMTAGEFAGLLMNKTKAQHAYWSETNPNDPNAEFLLRCKARAETWQRVQAMLLDLAREHNIAVVEPPK